MSSLYYLAYGSNLHPERLTQRVPSARFLGTYALSGYRLRFNKRGADGSAKCNLVAYREKVVWCAVFSMDPLHKPKLDQAETGYGEGSLDIDLNGKTVSAFTYIAGEDNTDDSLHPYDWYQEMVLCGARYHGFPADYLAELEAVVRLEDPDAARRKESEAVLHIMRQQKNNR